MCCCKFPPTVGLAIYIFLSVLVGLYFRQVRTIYITPTGCDIDHSKDCKDFSKPDFISDVVFDGLDNLGKKFSGNFYSSFNFDNNFRTSLRGMKT
ncbi:hypothetical protein WA026_017152 [Henosepilachna vigintioctopunctata]|uniref:Uncharacterized protein n=1 Tax=Henosepilachna vigintioctopunctata TaxID=420089 RepID=A0AAW1TUH7_9CUCU